MENEVSYQTIARTVVLVLALVNQILVSTGKVPLNLDESVIYDAVSLAFTIVSAVVACWKNNSFTSNAIEADKYLEELKGESK